MGNRGFWEGEGSSNMMTIAKKCLANPEKTSVIQKKTSLIRKNVANSETLEYDENRKKYLANPEIT